VRYLVTNSSFLGNRAWNRIWKEKRENEPLVPCMRSTLLKTWASMNERSLAAIMGWLK